LNKDATSRYSPAVVVKIEKTIVTGMPDIDRISTSRVEKQNHTLRMHCCRLTRLTNAFSKKLENFEVAVSLNFAYRSFCKLHGAIRCTPARPLASKAASGALRNLLNAVANNREYIERVKLAVEHLHNCRAIHCAAVPVHEMFRGQTVWQGDVEVFDLTGLP
jgi:hypothetical protein